MRPKTAALRIALTLAAAGAVAACLVQTGGRLGPGGDGGQGDGDADIDVDTDTDTDTDADSDSDSDADPDLDGETDALDGDADEDADASDSDVPPACEDGVQNGEETDEDCGGGTCPPCEAGLGCEEPSDCESRVCQGHRCEEPSCDDDTENGDETAEDCGGPDCAPCEVGAACVLDRDCEESVCDAGTCRVPLSCAELHAAWPLLPDAVYDIDPDGAAADTGPFEAYCDMTTDGGGWTLCLNSVAGSPNANRNLIDANTGTADWNTGHTRDCRALDTGTAQIRHLIIDSLEANVHNRYYPGSYGMMGIPGTWIAAVGVAARGGEADTGWARPEYHYGRELACGTPCAGESDPCWYYGACWTVIPAQRRPAYCTSGPDTEYYGCGSRYSVFFR